MSVKSVVDEPRGEENIPEERTLGPSTIRVRRASGPGISMVGLVTTRTRWVAALTNSEPDELLREEAYQEWKSCGRGGRNERLKFDP